MGAIAAWFIETALGAAIKGIWARFFPSTDEQLGALKQEVKENEMVIDAVTDKAKVDAEIDSMSDANVDKRLLERWTKR